MESSTLLGYVSGTVHVIAFIVYNKRMLKGLSNPNTTSWALWALLSSLNFASYLDMSDDMVKSTISLASASACIFTFVFSIFKGRITKPDFWDGLIFLFSGVSIMVWWIYQSSTYANLVLQLAIAISFIPTFRDVITDCDKEKLLPWAIWSGAYVISIIVVMLRWEGHYQDLAYPINGFVMHGIVGLLSTRKSKMK